MENLDCKTCEFKSNAAIKLSEIDLMRLSSNCSVVRFSQGEIIIKEGSLSLNIVYLREGLVKLHMEGPVKEQIIRLVKGPKYLGLPTVLGDRLNHYSVTALDTTEVCFINADFFKSLISKNGLFAYEVIVEMSRDELINYRNCINRTQKQLRGKLAEALLFLRNEVYKNDTFQLPLSREELANWLDSSRETVCRIMNEFAADRIISLDRRIIKVLNPQQLELISRTG